MTSDDGGLHTSGDDRWLKAADERWAVTSWRVVTGWREQTGTWRWRAAAVVGCRRAGRDGWSRSGEGQWRRATDERRRWAASGQWWWAVTVASMQAEAMGRRLLPSVTSYRSSPPAGSCCPSTARHHWSAAHCHHLSPPPVDSVTTHMAPPITASAWTVIGELHTYRWSSVLLTSHRLASRLVLEAFESLHELRYVQIVKICKVLHTKFREFQFLDGILWTKIRGRRFWGQINGDEVLRTSICGQRFSDKALWMKIWDNKFGADLWPLQCGSVRLSGLYGAGRCGFLLQAGAPRRVLCHTLQSGPTFHMKTYHLQPSNLLLTTYEPRTYGNCMFGVTRAAISITVDRL